MITERTKNTKTAKDPKYVCGAMCRCCCAIDHTSNRTDLSFAVRIREVYNAKSHSQKAKPNRQPHRFAFISYTPWKPSICFVGDVYGWILLPHEAYITLPFTTLYKLHGRPLDSIQVTCVGNEIRGAHIGNKIEMNSYQRVI